MFESKGFGSVEEFTDQDEARILIIANELTGSHDFDGISLLIHVELPEDTEKFVHRMIKNNIDEVPSIIFATDLELALVKKIEQTIGQKIPVTELPDEINIAVDQKDKKTLKTEKAAKNDLPRVHSPATFPELNESFHCLNECLTSPSQLGL